MAYGKSTEKLAWMGLKHDDVRLPEALQEAILALEEARNEVEAMVRKLPVPKGKRWIFSYKHGVAIAQADATGGSTTANYFDK